MPVQVAREHLTAMTKDMLTSESSLAAAASHFEAGNQAADKIADILHTVLPGLVHSVVNEYRQGAALLHQADEPFTSATKHLVESGVTRDDAHGTAPNIWQAAWRARAMLSDLLEAATRQTELEPESQIGRVSAISEALLRDLRALSTAFLDNDKGVPGTQQTIGSSRLFAETYLKVTNGA
jgi:hypothetical protein